jgi:glucose/arabinose dehydrogenase
MRNTLRAIAIAATVLLGTGPAAAAMYRCGNVFQDKPCDSGPQQVITPGRQGAATSAPAPAPKPGALPELSRTTADTAAMCARVGGRVDAVARKRDAGATAQQQMQGADPETVRAVQTVYSVGAGGKLTVAQMRAFAEMGCMADEQVKAQTQAAMRAAREADKQGLSPEQRKAAVEKASGLQDPCTSLREGIAGMDHVAKAGGEPRYLVAIGEQRAKMEQERARLNCR